MPLGLDELHKIKRNKSKPTIKQTFCCCTQHFANYVDGTSNWLVFLHDRPWISPSIKSISNELDITCHVFASQLPGHCDVITNPLWRHQQNVKRARGDAGVMCEAPRYSVIYGFVMSCKKWNDVCTFVTNCLCAHSSVVLVFISLVAAQLGK